MSLRAQLLANNNGYVDRAEMRRRIASNMARNLPTLADLKAKLVWAVIGTGPSVKDCLPEIRALKRKGAQIVSVNKAHDWLLQNGIVPYAHVFLDGHEWVKDYVQNPRRDVKYLLASQCHEEVFKRFQDYDAYLWHAGQDFEDQSEPAQMFKDLGYGFHPIVAGGSTVGQRVPIIGHILGARKFHMFGMDSSRRDGKLHAIPKKDLVDPENRQLAFKWKGKKWWFDTNVHMARQQMDFDKFIEDLPSRLGKYIEPGFLLTFHGSGLTPFWAATLGLHANPEFNKNPPKVGGYVRVTDMNALPESQPTFDAVTNGEGVDPVSFEAA